MGLFVRQTRFVQESKRHVEPVVFFFCFEMVTVIKYCSINYLIPLLEIAAGHGVNKVVSLNARMTPRNLILAVFQNCFWCFLPPGSRD